MPRYYAAYFCKFDQMAGGCYCRRFLGTIKAETDRQARVRLDMAVAKQGWFDGRAGCLGVVGMTDYWSIALMSPEGRFIGHKDDGRTKIIDQGPDEYFWSFDPPLSAGDYDEYGTFGDVPPYSGLLNEESVHV